MALTFFGRPALQLYQPDADAVSLVVEGRSFVHPMKRDRWGNWNLRLKQSFRELLHGLSYHFEVQCNNRTFTIADPFARRTERRQQQ